VIVETTIPTARQAKRILAMAISETAQRNHDAWFPKHESAFIGYPRTPDAIRVINQGTSP
jgi:hypothetical protein